MGAAVTTATETLALAEKISQPKSSIVFVGIRGRQNRIEARPMSNIMQTGSIARYPLRHRRDCFRGRAVGNVFACLSDEHVVA